MIRLGGWPRKIQPLARPGDLPALGIESAGDELVRGEAARSGLVRQPANSLSNLGFVVAGIAVAAVWNFALSSRFTWGRY